jgi:2-dehydropantoate 2-reductase
MKLNVLILGAGAIGCFVGGSLAATGHDVTLIGRQSLMEKIDTQGLQIVWPDRGVTSVTPRTGTALTGLATSFDYVLLTVKAPATTEAVTQLARADINYDKTCFVSLQNGIGNEEILAGTFSSEQAIGGTITIPIAVPSLGVIKISKTKGGIGLAPLVPGQAAQPLADALKQAGLETIVYTDYPAMKWSKLLLNIINNATSAILDQPPAEVIANSEIFKLEIAAIQEGVKVMAAQKIKVIPLPGYRVDWLARLVTTPWLPMGIKRMILRPVMVGGRGSKMPSLHIDLAAGRTHSEVNVLNGAIVQAGQRLGVSTPVNKALTMVLNGIVSGELNWADYKHQPARLLDTIARHKN